MRALLILVSVLAVGGCAANSRLSSYGMRFADAKVYVGRAGYAVWVHPEDDTIIIQEQMGGAVAGSFFEGLTLGAANTAPPITFPRLAGSVFLAQFECRPIDVYQLEDISTEMRFDCPDGVRPTDLDGQRFCTDTDPYSMAWADPQSIHIVDCDAD